MEDKIIEGGSAPAIEESKVRLNLKQSAKGELYFEFTVRGNTIEEVVTLAQRMKKEAITLCGG